MLIVKYRDITAGYLWRESDSYVFQYDEEFLANDSMPPISINLPKKRDPYFSNHLFPYFQSILPEGYNREIQARALGINVEDDWNLLANTCGNDTIGAITIVKQEDNG